MFGDSVVRIDPESGEVVGKPIRVGDRPLAVAVGEGSVWVFNSLAGTVSRIDPKTGKVISESARLVGRTGTPDYAGLAVADGSVWVSSPSEGTVVRLDVESNKADKPIRVGAGPFGLATAEGAVWVANYDDGTVSRIDAADGPSGGQHLRRRTAHRRDGGSRRRRLGGERGRLARADRPRDEHSRGRADQGRVQAPGSRRRRGRGVGREPVRQHALTRGNVNSQRRRAK